MHSSIIIFPISQYKKVRTPVSEKTSPKVAGNDGEEKAALTSVAPSPFIPLACINFLCWIYRLT